MRLVIIVIVTVLFVGCGPEDQTPPSSCLEGISIECTPQYTPTFDKIFEITLQNSCSVGGNACHSSAGAKGGISFDDIEQSYLLLLNPGTTDPRVVPGEPACSSLVHRLESDDSSRLMPPGNKLSPEVRCAIVQWIAAGAER
ncbi:MAG TPA: hypothetical protein EYN66_02175 [Myxococcales bacterium]|nr:hypothetical protein [Myxococcales bacterium]